jgi:hypothetical protein
MNTYHVNYFPIYSHYIAVLKFQIPIFILKFFHFAANDILNVDENHTVFINIPPNHVSLVIYPYPLSVLVFDLKIKFNASFSPSCSFISNKLLQYS